MDLALKSLGHRLRVARAVCQMSQSALADEMGVSRIAVNAWERDVSAPRMDRIEHLAKVLGTTPEWLLFGRGEMLVGSHQADPRP